MKKVLIFGINGFVGQYLAKEFLENGYEVFGSDIKEPESKDEVMKQVTFYKGDLLDYNAVFEIIKEIEPDMLVNLAAISSVGLSWKIPQKTMEVNVLGALNILEAVRMIERDVKIMFIGSSEEYEMSEKPLSEQTPLNANNPYGISKMTQESFVELYRQRYGMKIYYVRPFNHTGVGQTESFVLPSFCRQIAEIEKSGKPGVIYTGNLDIYRDFCDVRDVVRAYRMIIESDNCTKIYNVGSGTAYHLQELLNYIISLSQQKIEVKVSPKLFRPADTPIICCDRSYIKQELGWEPKYSIFDTLKEMYVKDANMDEYHRWLLYCKENQELLDELLQMKEQDERRHDAFYKNLEFGTGGLRGVLGAGTNRMNVFTVAKASQGLADYVNETFPVEERKIAVSYDSRIHSKDFAEVASAVFAANGIFVYLYDELMPTPCLSFAVRELHCAAGVMVTASHNPGEYNGYKVYGADGCQITTQAAKDIYEKIEKNDIFTGVSQMNFEEAREKEQISYVPDEVYEKFLQCVQEQSVLGDEYVDKNVSIVYSPLNGTGLRPVLDSLKRAGYGNITVVQEQEKPDGRFPTCPYPNPEIKEAMTLGMEYAKREKADLLIATDPDCDRVGIAVVDPEGKYQLLSGNETGLLLLDYVCAQRTKHGTMPEHPIFIKTIVTTDLAEKIADRYGVKTINVLTGFKFIGEQIGFLEAESREADYILGFEESYGYLSGSYVRDKDGVNAAVLICEMFAYYKTKGINLLDKLQELYKEYGYCLNELHTYKFQGEKGMHQMEGIMEALRADGFSLEGKTIKEILDYKKGIQNLPKSNVIKMVLEDGSTLVVRPSGTEPKLKIYTSILGECQESAKQADKEIVCEIEKLFER